MSNITDRTKGKLEEMGGTVQKTIGKVLGNEEMQVKGAAHEVMGEAKQQAAKAGERVKGAVESIVGSVKATVGEAIGNDRLHAKGKIQELTGEARKDLNK